MRIAAALCWYDEEPETLARCVRSVAPLVDSLVAYDGAWEGFPHWRPFSGFKPMLAIRDAATDAGIDAESLQRMESPWPSQAEKRTALYRASSERADWVLVIDADEELVVDDAASIRERIAIIDHRLSPDAITIRVATPGVGAGGHDTATAPGGVRWQPRLLRADLSLTVGPASHRTIASTDALIQCEHEGDREAHEGKRAGRIATLPGLSIVNRTHSRCAARLEAKREYGKARAHRGID